MLAKHRLYLWVSRIDPIYRPVWSYAERCPIFPLGLAATYVALLEYQLMSFVPLIINLLCGAVGGNVAGGLIKKLNLGTVGNSLAGILGGGIGGQLLGMLGMSGGSGGALDLPTIISNVGAGGVGGGVVLAVVGLIKNVLMSSKAS
ncbi:MAG: hypothetical protein Aurels2KO_44650 [Aureliella sp.]